jgi:hypothetical protein
MVAIFIQKLESQHNNNNNYQLMQTRRDNKGEERRAELKGPRG